MHSAQITEWRKLRDAYLLSGPKPGEKIGRPSADQAEIARLTRELDSTRRRLAKTEAAAHLVEERTLSLEELRATDRTAAHSTQGKGVGQQSDEVRRCRRQ